MSEAAAAVEARLLEFLGDIDPSSKRGAKRLAIIDAATASFAEVGYRATSMDELAAAVGVAKGTLYLYFPKKIDLLFACAAREKLKWIPELHALLDGPGPAAVRLHRWLVSMMLVPARSPLLSRLLDGDAEMVAMLADYPPELMAEAQTQWDKLIRPLLDEVLGTNHAFSDVEIRDRANVLRAFGHFAALIRHEWLRPGMSAERFAALLASMVIDGLRPRGRNAD